MVLYFSGTGNSRYVAEQIARAAGDQLVSMNVRIKNRDVSPIQSGERVVFSVPTYAWRIPRIVRQWILDTEFIGAKQAWFVMTCGDEIGNAAKFTKELCQIKQFSYMGTGQIVMPENYIAMFAVPKPTTSQKIILNAQPEIARIIGLIAEGKAIPDVKPNVVDRVKSSIVNPIYYKMFVNADAFAAHDRCTGCGTCAQLCPLNNIEITDGKPVWGKNCTHCMACISYCPVEAIEYGKASVGKPRYRCEL